MKLLLRKRVAFALATILVAVVAPLSALAGFEPANRPVKVYNGPNTPAFTYPVFNSWINTSYGDERAFVDAATSIGGSYKDQLVVSPGQTVTIRLYVHNGAAPDLNGTNFDGPGVAHNTRAQVFLPTATSTQLRSFGYIVADNTNPIWVADSVDFNSSVPVSLEYVPGTARLSNRANPNGVQLSDAIVNHDTTFNPNRSAAPIGWQQMNGVFPACFEFASFITLQVRVNGPSLQLTKQVTTPGSTNWQSSMNANPGDTVSWLLNYKNTSNVQVNNIVIKDQMPAHMSLVPGSVMRFDSNNPNGQQLSDTGLFADGVNVGSLGVNGGGFIRFRTTVNNDFTANECGNINLVNTATIAAQGVPSKEASATVVVTKNCVPPSTPPPTTPPTPTSPLPRTGVEGVGVGLVGSSGLGYASYAYLRSKKALRAALRGWAKK